MNITSSLRNDRNFIIAIVAEHYTFDDKYLRRAIIKNINDPERDSELQSVHHSDIKFVYDTRKNVIYWDIR